MKQILLPILAAAAALGAAPAGAQSADRPVAAQAEQARIAFPGFRLRSFYAPTDRVIYLQDQRRNWYRADIVGPCWGLSWAHAVGIDTRGSSSFDRFSAIRVGRERCQINSLTYSDKPERRGKRKRDRQA